MTSTAFELDDVLRKKVEQILWWDYEKVFLQRNGVQGMLNEAYLYFHWGFDLQKFPDRPLVLFWHSRNDTIMSWSVIEENTSSIPRRKTRLFTGGHLTFLMKVEDVLTQMKQALQGAVEPSYNKKSLLYPSVLSPAS